MYQHPHFAQRYSGNSYSSSSSRASTLSSDLLPPPPIGGGLAFSALWDPEAGTVTLSTTADVSTRSKTYDDHTTVDVPCDVQSHELSPSSSLDSSHLLMSSRSGIDDAIAAFRIANHGDDDDGDDDHLDLIGSPIASSHDHHGRDMYIRSPRFPINARHYSCFDRLDEGLSFNAETAFVEWERMIWGGNNRRRVDNPIREARRRPQQRDSEGSMVFVELVLHSTFSIGTTSTSSFVEVKKSGIGDDDDRVDPYFFRPSQRPKLLKRRPPPPPPVRRPNGDDKFTRLLRGFKAWKRGNLDDSWVKIDVTQVVTQSCIQV